MNYAEMIDKAMKGRSVNSLAKEWGLQQRTLDRYVKGQSMPDYTTVRKIAKEAGITGDEVLEILEHEEQSHKVKNFKLQMGFARPAFLAAVAATTMVVTLFLTPGKAEARTYSPTFDKESSEFILCKIASEAACPTTGNIGMV